MNMVTAWANSYETQSEVPFDLIMLTGSSFSAFRILQNNVWKSFVLVSESVARVNVPFSFLAL